MWQELLKQISDRGCMRQTDYRTIRMVMREVNESGSQLWQSRLRQEWKLVIFTTVKHFAMYAASTTDVVQVKILLNSCLKYISKPKV